VQQKLLRVCCAGLLSCCPCVCSWLHQADLEEPASAAEAAVHSLLSQPIKVEPKLTVGYLDNGMQ
jgi:hypothetical protein